LCISLGNFVRIFLLNPNFLFQHRNYLEGMATDRKLHMDTLIFIPRWKTMCFHIPDRSKIYAWRNTANSYVIPQKGSLWNFLVNTLLLYIPLLTLTDRITDRETHTLASCKLEEPFFQLCCCVVSVFGSGGKWGDSLYIIFQWNILGSSGK
jgi:hypothetical protein